MLRVIKTETTDDVLRPESQLILRKVIACAHRPDRKIGLCVRAKSVGEFGSHRNQACLRKSGSLSKPADSISRTAARAFVWPLVPLLLALALVPSIGCGSIHLHPDSELAPSEKAENVWTPPRMVKVFVIWRLEGGLTSAVVHLANTRPE